MHGSGARLVLTLLAGVVAATLATPAAAGPDVVVTIKPLHALVARIMAGVGRPHLLVQGALSAHTYVLKPSDVAKLNDAEIFFRMSEAMEPFTAKIARTLPRQVQVVTLQDAPGLQLLERRTGAPFEQTESDGHGDDRGLRQRQGMIDGHAWLDPANAEVMADRIAEVLSAKAPLQAPVFAANAGRLKVELEALDAELARELAPVAGKPYVVFHDALHYFELRYGLKPVGAIAVSPEVPPGAARLSALRRQVTARGAVCVFAEAQFDARLVSAVAEGTPARIATIDPEGSRIEPGPDLYFTLLRNLARDLRACLAPAG
jgi:zinc transport system substrate-binding protein